MLTGEYEHTLDDKNRLTLPARFRQVFGGGIVVTRGMEGCLAAYTREDFEAVVQERLRVLDPLSVKARRMKRFFFTGAVEAEPDKQGRINLPPALITHAKLGREVVVAGVQDHLEIWDRDAWQQERAEFEGSAEDVAEDIAAERD